MMGENSIHTKISSVLVIMSILASGLLAFLPMASINVGAHTWTVPGDFPTIQIAIDASVDGDMIFVAQGAYTENLVIDKSISLVGENSETTIIDGQGTGHVIDITGGWVNISGFTIMHSTANNGFNGIRSQNTWNSTFQGNIVHGCNMSIALENVTGLTIYRNTIHNNTHGIFIGQPTSQQNNIDNNIIINNYNSSMWLDNVSNNSFQGNRMSNATWAGLNMISSSNNTFTWNNISDNPNYGIYLAAGQNKSNNNTFHHNNFCNNSLHAVNTLATVNIWDNGSAGNYWDDYVGLDNGFGGRTASDGIGDTILPAPDNVWVDWFPLMENVTPEAPVIVGHGALPDLQEAGSSVLVWANITDPHMFPDARVNVTYPDASYLNVSMAGNDDGSNFTYNDTYVLPGTYNYSIWAEGYLGGINNISGSFVVQDTTPPDISNVTATPQYQDVGGIVRISANISDIVAVNQVFLIITHPDSSHVNISMTKDAGLEYFHEASYGLDGEHSYYIFANDTSGNGRKSPTQTFEILTQPTRLEIEAIGIAIAGQAFDLNVTIFDEHDNIAEHYNGTISFTIVSEGAVAPANYIFESSDKGEASFEITLFKTGTATIIVSDTEDQGLSDSLGIVVWPGPLFFIEITPAGPTTYDAGGTGRTYSAAGYDAYRNSVSFTPDWSTTGQIGDIYTNGIFSPANMVGSGDVVCSGSYLGNMVTNTSAVFVVDNVPPVFVNITDIEALDWVGVNISASECYDLVWSTILYIWEIEGLDNITTQGLVLDSLLPGVHNATLHLIDGAGNAAAKNFTIIIFRDADLDGIPDHQDDDIDGDGLSNIWETDYGLDPYYAGDATADGDSDGLNNLEENMHGTDPTEADTDGDGMDDGDEIARGKDPLVPDNPVKSYTFYIILLIIVAIVACTALAVKKIRDRSPLPTVPEKTGPPPPVMVQRGATGIPKEPKEPPPVIREKKERARPDDWKP